MRDIPEETTIGSIAVSEIVDVAWDDEFTFDSAPAFQVFTQFSARTVPRDKLTSTDLKTLRELASTS